MIRLFTGYDEREAIGWHAFEESVMENTQETVSFIPLSGKQRDGTNAFTYERFLVPAKCNWSGWAIFADGADMLCAGDIAELWAMRDESKAVQVVKHDYRTRHPRKYIGTSMETDNSDYPRKNWSSLILWNCAHLEHFEHRRELETADGAYLHRFRWLKDESIGELPREWNWLADEYGENETAKLLHWTCGIPGFLHYRNAPHADKWLGSLQSALQGWQQ